MALKITTYCSVCYACETVCPASAINSNGSTFVIDPALCSECDDIDSPRCLAICPEPDAIIINK